MTVVQAWALVGMVFAVLLVLWTALGALFDMIGAWQRELRESEPRNAGAPLTEERGD